MDLHGNFKLFAEGSSQSGSPGSNSSFMQSGNSNHPPRAIYIKLSNAALQQAKSFQFANPQGIPSLAIAISSTNQPYALNIAESSYGITQSVAPGDIQILGLSSNSSTSKGKGRVVSHSTQSLQCLTSGCRDIYTVGMSSTPRIIEKTAANMSERMRERNLQLEKEKEGRRVVMVEDDSFLNGKNRKGKGKKGPMKGPSTASPLLRASAISAKRSISPAGISPRNSPLLGPTSTTLQRAPSRLVASEAAKGLTSWKGKEKAMQSKPKASPSPPPATFTTSEPVIAGTAEVASDTGSQIAEKLRMASSASSNSSYSSSASTVVSNGNGTNASLSDATTVSNDSHTLKSNNPSTESPHLSGSVYGSVASVLAPSIGFSVESAKLPAGAGVHKPPAVPQYHHLKVDESDLASASSSSEDEDAAMPLAKRLNTPIKALAIPLPPVIPPGKNSVQPGSKAKRAVSKSQRGGIKNTEEPKKSASLASHTLTPAPPLQDNPVLNPSTAAISSASRTRSISSNRSASPHSVSPSVSPPAEVVVPLNSATIKANLTKRKVDTVKPSLQSHRSSIPNFKKVRTASSLSADKNASTAAVNTKSDEGLTQIASPRSSGLDTTSGMEQKNPGPVADSATAGETEPVVGMLETVEKKKDVLAPISASVSLSPVKADLPNSLPTDVSVGKLAPSSTSASSRTSTSFQCPGLHPLPAKPTSEIQAHSLTSAKLPVLSRSVSPLPQTSLTSEDNVISSGPLSPAEHRKHPASGVAVKPLPASLPARPPNIFAPVMSRSSVSADHTTVPQKGASSTQHAGNSSPIVSNFPKRAESAGSGRILPSLSAMPSPLFSPKDTSAYHNVLNKQVVPSELDTNEANTGRNRLVKQSKTTRRNRHDIEFTSSEEEEGEEDEEGEVDAEGESVEVNEVEIETPRGRSTDQKSVTSSGVLSRNAVDIHASSAILPSIAIRANAGTLRKGRAAELQAAETGSGPKGQIVSRASTPNSHGPISGESPQNGIERGRKRAFIQTDADFRHYSRRFAEELFPIYAKLHKRLEIMQKELEVAGGRTHLSAHAPEVARLVEEANERGRHLEEIREMLVKYNQDKENSQERLL